MRHRPPCYDLSCLSGVKPQYIHHCHGFVVQIGLKIGVKTRGCNGLTYTLEYCSGKGKFDEIVEQEGMYECLYVFVFTRNALDTYCLEGIWLCYMVTITDLPILK